MDDRRSEHLMSIGDRPVAVDLLETRCTVNRLGGKISRAIKGQPIVAIKEHHRFKRLAALQLPKDTGEQWTERLRGDRLESLAHMCVAGDTLDAVDRCQIALCPFLVKREQRRRFEGKHGERRQQRIRSRNVRIAQAGIRDGSKAISNYAQECIGGEMLASFECNNRHGHPRQEDIKSFR